LWFQGLNGGTDTSGSWKGNVILNGRDKSSYLYRRNRVVDPTTGVFTQEDPVGLAGGLNAYGFG